MVHAVTARACWLAVAMVAYPVVVWLGMSSGSPRQIAIILLAVMTPAVLMKSRRAGASRHVRGLAAVPATILAVLVAAALLLLCCHWLWQCLCSCGRGGGGWRGGRGDRRRRAVSSPRRSL